MVQAFLQRASLLWALVGGVGPLIMCCLPHWLSLGGLPSHQTCLYLRCLCRSDMCSTPERTALSEGVSCIRMDNATINVDVDGIWHPCVCNHVPARADKCLMLHVFHVLLPFVPQPSHEPRPPHIPPEVLAIRKRDLILCNG